MTATATGVSEFPVPADLDGFWMFDQVHAPRPLTPLSAEILLTGLSDGFRSAMREVGYPLGFAMRAVNTYGYIALLPHQEQEDEPDEGSAWTEDSAALMQRLGERWEQEWLPAILPGLERLRTLDYAALSDDALVAVLGDLRRDLVARWRVHGYLLFTYQAASTFDDFYREALAPVDVTEPYQLLSGFQTQTFYANRGLWQLSRLVRRSPHLARLFAETTTADRLAALEGCEAGRAYLAELRTYLEEFGWRADAILELAEPMWREDLAIPLNALRGLIDRGDDEDPDARLQRIAERRQRLLAEARSKLVHDPERLARFDLLYEEARHHVIVDENHNFYIDQMGNAALRLPVLELGRRLVGHGAVDRIEEVFLLTTTQIKAGLGGVDQRAEVARQRAVLAHWATVTPPPSIGEPPADDELDSFIAAMIKVDAPPEPQPQTPTTIRGTPASPGTARGRARVARSLEEASTVRPGQILVCEMTLPPWSVLFATIRAVVADTGGILSHCATVAREYGIPCVVGTTVGTTAIRDGMLLEVNGTTGEVKIVGGPT